MGALGGQITLAERPGVRIHRKTLRGLVVYFIQASTTDAHLGI